MEHHHHHSRANWLAAILLLLTMTVRAASAPATQDLLNQQPQQRQQLLETNPLALGQASSLQPAAAAQRARASLRIYPNSSPNLAPAGSPYILTCRGEGDHPNLFHDLKWQGPKGQLIRQGVRLTGGALVLQFDKPNMEDSGEYTCTGNYQESEVFSAITRVEFFNEITMDCPEHQSIIEGHQDQSINCRVYAQPSPTVEWTKNDKPLSAYGARYTFHDDRIQINGPVTIEDAGQYNVTATVIENGRLKVRTIITEVYTEPKIITQPQAEYQAAMSHEFQLSCLAEGNPQPRIYWYDPEKRNVSTEGGYIVDPDKGLLKITNLQLRDNGTFECVARNDVSESRARFPLRVGIKPEIITFENKTVDEDGNVELECVSLGNPRPKIEIRLNGQQPLKMGQQYVERIDTEYMGETTVQKVILRKVPRIFDSLYYCSSENFAGKVERPGQLKVKFRPDLSGTPKDQWIKPGRPAAITCVVRAFPEPTITWFKDNIQLTNQEYEMTIDPTQNTHLLTIKPYVNTMSNVFGMYTCKASNQLGENAVPIELRQARRPNPIEYVQMTPYPTYVKMLIEAPADDGGLLIKYYYVTYVGESRLSTWSEKHRGNRTFNYVVQDRNSRTSGPYILNDLIPEYNYLILISAENDVGRSDQSRQFSVLTTRPKYPDAPVIVTPDRPLTRVEPSTGVVNSKFSNGYKLAWSPPTYDNGKPIDYYLITYYEAQYVEGRWVRSNNSAEHQIQHDRIRQERADIRDLKPFTYYQIEVRAHNEMGISEPAKIVIQTAEYGGPSLSYPDDATSSFLFDLSPSNSMVFAVMILMIVFLILVDVTCCMRYDVGALSIIRSWCSSKQKMREAVYN